MNDIIQEIKRQIGILPETRKNMIISVDGRCAAGKSTLANALQAELGCSVFHMDDFFLRPEQRTNERLNTPGENVDHERFYKEILFPLLNGNTRIIFRPFDCRRRELIRPLSVDVGRIVLVEGSYSCHPSLWDCYDLHIFLTVSAAEQMNRIIRREGVERSVTFREKWIPLEESYFKAFHIEERCELRFDTGKQELYDA